VVFKATEIAAPGEIQITKLILLSLSSGSPDAREGAIYVLGALGKAVIPCLEEILKAEPERHEIRRILDEVRGRAGTNP